MNWYKSEKRKKEETVLLKRHFLKGSFCFACSIVFFSHNKMYIKKVLKSTQPLQNIIKDENLFSLFFCSFLLFQLNAICQLWELCSMLCCCSWTTLSTQLTFYYITRSCTISTIHLACCRSNSHVYYRQQAG